MSSHCIVDESSDAVDPDINLRRSKRTRKAVERYVATPTVCKRSFGPKKKTTVPVTEAKKMKVNPDEDLLPFPEDFLEEEVEDNTDDKEENAGNKVDVDFSKMRNAQNQDIAGPSRVPAEQHPQNYDECSETEEEDDITVD